MERATLEPAPSGHGATAPFHARFEDATEGSGLVFAHTTGGFGEKRLPETMGAGACVLDVDGDGALDVFLVDSTRFEDRPGDRPGRCVLFRGRGDGTFVDATAETGAGIELYGMGCAAADADGDGDTDLFVTALGADVFLRNEGGVLRDATAGAGLAGATWQDPDGAARPEWTTAALWLDADGDRDLDLFVAGYCQWTPALEIFTTLDGVEKAFTTPDRYEGLPSRLWENRGDGTFAPAPLEAGAPSLGKSLGAACWDLDGDGALAIVVSNDTRPNFLFERRADGTWAELGARAGLAYDERGRARAGMGIDVAELGLAGAPGTSAAGEPAVGGTVVAIGNFAGEPLSLYERTPTGAFRPAARRAGLAAPTVRPLAFGLALLDLDLDGWLDLVVVNGHIEPDIARFRPEERHAQRAQLFRGRPDGTFEDVSDRAGPAFERALVGRGLAWGDLDGDGDLDLVVTQNGGPAALWLNRLQETRPRRYLRVALEGRAPNTDAIGARLELDAGGRTRVHTVRTGSSYLSQGELTATFGLGDLERVDELRVRWPDGRLERVPVEGVDRTLVVREP